MTDKEELLVNRVGCLAHVLIHFIRKYPDYNSRLRIAKHLNMSVKTVRTTINNMVELDVIAEEPTERVGVQWNKKFIINPETEWRM